ncbi:MAG: hypothetical protein WA973_17545 [Mesorhizobium sp.]|jgi:hypothetical protein|uniref:Uncharacterized protein n=1 Tax=Aquamicrobium soli TaxID=1811518 RepID=A0ABV7KCV3_9HYPH
MSLDDWDSIRPDRRARAIDAGMGLLRITLLFGSAVVALALMAVPVLDNYNDRQQVARGGLIGVDSTTTGSINRTSTYTIRRSVLQSSPDSVCVIRANRHSGDC